MKIQVAVGFVKECGALLQDITPLGLHGETLNFNLKFGFLVSLNQLTFFGAWYCTGLLLAGFQVTFLLSAGTWSVS